MLILEKDQKFDYCECCGGIIADMDYFYSRLPTVMGYRCSQCGFSQFFVWDDNKY